MSSLFSMYFLYALRAMVLNTEAYVITIIRTTLYTILNAQKVADKDSKLNKRQTSKNILFPQALVYISPAYSNEVMLLVNSTSLVSVITIIYIAGYMQSCVFQHTFFMTIFYSYYILIICIFKYYFLVKN